MNKPEVDDFVMLPCALQFSFKSRACLLNTSGLQQGACFHRGHAFQVDHAQGIGFENFNHSVKGKPFGCPAKPPSSTTHKCCFWRMICDSPAMLLDGARLWHQLAEPLCFLGFSGIVGTCSFVFASGHPQSRAHSNGESFVAFFNQTTPATMLSSIQCLPFLLSNFQDVCNMLLPTFKPTTENCSMVGQWSCQQS